MDLAEACYGLTRNFPREDAYGMTSQVRRSAAAIPANIAEGQGRDGAGKFVQFLRIAQGSLKELGTHLIIGIRGRADKRRGDGSHTGTVRDGWKDATGSDPLGTGQEENQSQDRE